MISYIRIKGEESNLVEKYPQLKEMDDRNEWIDFYPETVYLDGSFTSDELRLLADVHNKEFPPCI